MIRIKKILGSQDPVHMQNRHPRPTQTTLIRDAVAALLIALHANYPRHSLLIRKGATLVKRPAVNSLILYGAQLTLRIRRCALHGGAVYPQFGGNVEVGLYVLETHLAPAVGAEFDFDVLVFGIVGVHGESYGATGAFGTLCGSDAENCGEGEESCCEKHILCKGLMMVMVMLMIVMTFDSGNGREE